MSELRLPEQNVVLLAGRLAFDADHKVTKTGTALCSFKIAVNRRFKDTKTGEWKDDTAWVPVEIWGEAAARLKDRMKKGSPVHVEGRLKSDEFEKDGQKRSVLKVVARRVQVLEKSGAGGPSAGGDTSNADLEEVPF